MSKPITNKTVPVHLQCQCGYNEVYKDLLAIRWKDFKKAGIERVACVKGQKPFLTCMQYVATCFNCKPE